ncbi:MAG: LysE family translocator [Desulfosarcinaceae bacterium]|nr:LysE family translocator [Desulfosarcinaceae bacterium]
MLTALTAGILLGLSAGLMPGPMLTLVISQTLRHNVREGMKVALSPLFSDLPIIAITLFALGHLADFERIMGVLSLLGGLYVLWLAWECFQSRTIETAVSDDRPHSLRKGVILNLLNPAPYLFWATVGGPLIIQQQAARVVVAALFLISFYSLLVGSKLGLAWLTGKTRRFLSSSGYRWLMRLLGLFLIGFAGVMFQKALMMIRG